MHKGNYLHTLQKNKEYRKILAEERKLLDIAVQIADARKEKKWTQSQLAKRVGMPQSQLARIESGNGNATISTLYRVVNALNKRLILEN